MGQNSSHHDRSSKHRQSTRSLPDASMHRLDNEAAQWAAYANQGVGSKKSKENNGVSTNKTSTATGYEQNLENFRRNWQKAAAPYYAPPSVDDQRLGHPVGPRSLDGNLHRQYPGSAVPNRRVVIRNEDEFDDRWSDVASDMYRLRKHAPCRSSGSSRYCRPDGRTYEISDVKSDCSAPSSKIYKSRKYKRSGTSSESGVPLSLVPENHSSDVHACESIDVNRKYHSNDGKKRSKSVQNFRVQDPPQVHRGQQGPPPEGKPPRPPKKIYSHYGRLDENPIKEKNLKDFYQNRDSKVKFESSNNHVQSSPSSDFSSPKSPTSSECDKLVIQSLRAELSAERNLRIEIEHRSKKDGKEMESLRRTCESLKKETDRLQISKKTKDLEVMCRQLTDRLKQMGEEKICMEREGLQQKTAYDRCLDDIADRVAQAVINQKTLKSECVRLQKRVFELEWKNKILKSQIEEKSINSDPLSTDSNSSTIAQNTSISISKYQNSNSKPIFRLPNGSLGSCDSITSFGDQNLMTGQILVPTISPLSNGGEALCSRPTSFNFDAYAAASESLACASDLDSSNEIPRNFAEIYYGEIIDDPFQQNSAVARQSTGRTPAGCFPPLNHYNTPEDQRQRTPVLSRSFLGQRPSVRRSASASDGSNDTLCPNGENEPEDTQQQYPANHADSPKREIIVNMVRTLTIETDFSRIFRNPSSRLTKLLSTDDGYSTMSSQNYLELLYNPLTKSIYLDRKTTKPDEKSLKFNFKSFSEDDLLQISSEFPKRFLSDTQLNRNLPRNHRAKQILRRFSKGIENNFLSSRNDLTEFERDMLLYEDEEDKREALFELDAEMQVLFDQDTVGPAVDSKPEDQKTKKIDIDQSPIDSGDEGKFSPIPPSMEISVKPSKLLICRRTGEKLNDSSTTSSYTSDDSEDDGAATMQEWLKQLKIQKAKGNLAVVRYTPADLRPSILRRDVFHRFGESERKALTYFDFLYRKSPRSSDESPEAICKTLRAPKICLRNGRSRLAGKRKSGSFSNVQTFSTNDDYENLPYHRLTRTLSIDLSNKKSSIDRWRRWESSSSSSLDRQSRRSYGSSLFLSDLCVADRTLSSSSSLSFTNF